jgi:hypothetical protein
MRYLAKFYGGDLRWLLPFLNRCSISSIPNDRADPVDVHQVHDLLILVQRWTMSPTIRVGRINQFWIVQSHPRVR